MQRCQNLPGRWWFTQLLLVMLIVFSSGCDQIEDGIETATGGKEDTSKDTEVVQQPVEEPTKDPVNDPPAPEPLPQPTWQEVLADFQKLRPDQISDAALGNVADSPEAAAAITEIDLSNTEGVSGNGLRLLGKMENLQSLTLRNGRMPVAELANVTSAKSLTQLDISSSQADDQLVEHLTSLPELQTLILASTKISPRVGGGLSQMKNLVEVDLQSTPVDDSTVALLATMPLVSVNLAKTNITNGSLPILMKMNTLESLSLSYTNVNGAAFKGFPKDRLKYLNVTQTAFGVEGLVAIKGMKSLEELVIYRAGLVQHNSANVFRTFPNLKRLNAGANQIGNPALERFFKGHRTLQELMLYDTKAISDPGLEALIGIKTLKVLDVHKTSVTQFGGQALKAKLPNCQIITPDGTY